jgi:deoxyribonuclease (pyrimidine dimer)
MVDKLIIYVNMRVEREVNMTRINCVPVSELVDKHLLAEYRELPRLRHLKPRVSSINQYVLGKGHCIFFLDKGKYLESRHSELCNEMKRRGFTVNLPELKLDWICKFMNDWTPTRGDIKLNRERIKVRLDKM